MKKLIFILVVFSICILGQTREPEKILKDVVDNFSKIHDYKVDVEIKIDVSFLKVPDTKAVIYFKQPDKTHIESRGFALLPKGAMDISPSSLLKGKYTAFFDRVEDYEGIKATVIKTIPLGESENVILSTFWIDREKSRILKVEVSTKLNGTFNIDLKYNNKIRYSQLPSSMVFSFDVSKLNISKRFTGGEEKDKDSENNTGPILGKVFVNYSNYVVNQGIPDSVFTKPREKVEKKRH